MIPTTLPPPSTSLPITISTVSQIPASPTLPSGMCISRSEPPLLTTHACRSTLVLACLRLPYTDALSRHSRPVLALPAISPCVNASRTAPAVLRALILTPLTSSCHRSWTGSSRDDILARLLSLFPAPLVCVPDFLRPQWKHCHDCPRVRG